MARQLVSYDDLASPQDTPSLSSNKAQIPPNTTIAGAANNLSNRPVSNRSADTPTPQPDFIGPVMPGLAQGTSGGNGYSNSGSPATKKRKINTSGGQGGRQNQQQNTQRNGGKQKGKWKDNRRGGQDNNMAKEAHSNSVFSANVQHWDEPELEVTEIGYEEGYPATAQGDESMKEVEMELSEGVEEEEDGDDDDEEEEESRFLSQAEIWDDSALIEAWDAANEEYEALHGNNKDWKKERVHKSPLWYNKPPDKPPKKDKGKSKASSRPPAVDPVGVQSQPHDLQFSTAQQDAMLDFAVPPKPPGVPTATGQIISNSASHYTGSLGQAGAQNGIDGAEGTVDEAFTRALGAMYWTGYWTAMYHARRSASIQMDASALADAVEENEDEEERLDHELTEALISTQR